MIDSLKSKYQKLEISSFQDLVKLMEFTFVNENTENLIAAIKHFESNGLGRLRYFPMYSIPYFIFIFFLVFAQVKNLLS